MLLIRVAPVFSLITATLTSTPQPRSDDTVKGVNRVIERDPRAAYCLEIERLGVPQNVSELLVSTGDVRSEEGLLPFPDGVADHVELIGIGIAGCVYGLVWHGRIAVAVKTSKVADDPISEKEIMVLRKIGQYRGEARLTLPDPKTGEEQAERLFVFMKYIHGHDFERTEGYRTKVQAFTGTSLTSSTAKCQDACRDFITKTAAKVNELYLRYLLKHKVVHWDVGVHNIIFSESWDTDEGEADLIDWGLSQLLEEDHSITRLRRRHPIEEHVFYLQNRCG